MSNIYMPPPIDSNPASMLRFNLFWSGFSTPASQLLAITHFELNQFRMGKKSSYFKENGVFQKFLEDILYEEEKVVASPYGEVWKAFENLYLCGRHGGEFHYPSWQVIVLEIPRIERQNKRIYPYPLEKELQTLWRHHSPIEKRQPPTFYKALENVMDCGVLYIYQKTLGASPSFP